MAHKNYFQLVNERPDLFTMTGEDAPIRLILEEQALCDLEEKLGYPLGIMYEDSYIILLRDGVIFPNGREGSYFRILPKVNSDHVVILPVVNGKILIMSHYRHGLQKTFWEIPRGMNEPGLSTEENAYRELLEETGISDASLHFLGRTCADTGTLAIPVTIYLAEIAQDMVFAPQDKEEAISEYRLVTLQELQELIAQEEILDGFTLSAVALAMLSGKIA